ncbi:hypothetical protein GQ600_26530 [Phytophthora cactorum]|nr:hypothetical protein GQ600_26530 [Phytophthora cactorum]
MAETTTPNNSVEAAKALPDQTVDMMNADSAGIVDSKLGFGFLEGQLSQMTCRAKVKGFALPDTIGGNLTTVKGAMSLIGELNQLPIDCAVPVGIETIPIKTISVETQIRDQKVLDKLTDVLLRLEKTGHRSTTIYQFVEYLMDKFEDASMSKRSLLPKLNNLVQDVARALAGHSKCVELYKRDDEYRLHTDNCDHNSVTASASEIMFFSTLGLASIPGRNYQWKLFNYAEPWSVPQHYKLRQFCNTHAIAGYYDRVKVELLFNDDAKVDEWRNKLHNLFARPVNQPFGWLFGARCS